MATFTVKVDTGSLEKALSNRVADIKVYLEKKLDKIVERLAKEVAQPIAQQSFDFATEENNEPVVVTVEKVRGGYSINALGESVCFIEFGAGVLADPTHPFADNVPFLVRAGSWSDPRKGEFYRTGHQYWHYKKKRYEGVQAQRGMYEAYKAVLMNINRIVAEELK